MGTTSNCRLWYTVVAGDNCYSIGTSYNISFGEFSTWNADINSACTNLEIRNAYCVAGPALPTQGRTAVTNNDGTVVASSAILATAESSTITAAGGGITNKIPVTLNDPAGSTSIYTNKWTNTMVATSTTAAAGTASISTAPTPSASSPAAPSTGATAQKGSLSKGAIIGIAVGSAAAGVVFFLLFLFFILPSFD